MSVVNPQFYQWLMGVVYNFFMNIKETKIVRSSRKSLALTITSDATLIVKAPKLVPKFLINAFIRNQEKWIQTQLKKLEKRPVALPKSYKSGEIFLFLGMKLELEYAEVTDVVVKDGKLLFPKGLEFRAQKQILAWYKIQARQIISQQVEDFSAQMKASYTSLTFSDTKSQWGSCTHDNKLQFSWRLVMTPITVLNYVVIHELAHTTEKNHSRKFWELVNKYCPSYNRQRKWLKEHGNTLVV
jgi:predicted metal-dependent hydrolase